MKNKDNYGIEWAYSSSWMADWYFRYSLLDNVNLYTLYIDAL